MAVSAGFYFRPHYFILLLPAASLLAGLAVTSAYRFLTQRRFPASARMIPLLIFIVACAFSLWDQRAFLFEPNPAAAAQKIYAANPFAEAIWAAKIVRASTTEADTIAVFGSEPEFYFLSARHSATSYIYMYDLIKTQPYQLQMRQENDAPDRNSSPPRRDLCRRLGVLGMAPRSEQDEFFGLDGTLHPR